MKEQIRKCLSSTLKKDIRAAVNSIKISKADTPLSMIEKARPSVQQIIQKHLEDSIKDNAPDLVHEVLTTGGEIIAYQLAIDLVKEIYSNKTLENAPEIEDPSNYTFTVKTLKDDIIVISAVEPTKEFSPGIKETESCLIETFSYLTEKNTNTAKEKWFEYANSLNQNKDVQRPVKYGITITTDINDQKSFSKIFHGEKESVDSFLPGEDGDITESKYYDTYEQAKKAQKESTDIEKMQAVDIKNKNIELPKIVPQVRR